MALTLDHRKCSRYQFVKWAWKYTHETTSISPRGQWVNHICSSLICVEPDICIDQPVSSWWGLVPRCQIGTRSSRITWLNFLSSLKSYYIMGHMFNSFWPSDAIWRHRSGSTLVKVMACCLTPPGHYLNQCWLIMNGVLWHSPKTNFTWSAHDINS